MSWRRLPPTLALLVGLHPSDGSAQLHYGADVALHARHEWRGVRLHDGAVLQPDLFVGFGREIRVTAGAFTSLELAGPSEGDVGFGATLGEADLWIEASAPIGDAFDVAAGFVRYLYDTDAARGAPAELVDTSELYGRVSWIGTPLLVPEVRAWWDVGSVNGLYGEASLAIRVPFRNQGPAGIGSIFIMPRLGYNFGQDAEPAKAEPGHFADPGVTHWGLTAELPIGPLPVGPLEATIRIATTFEWKIDARTKLDGDDERRFTWWPSLWVSLLGPRCRISRGFCPGPVG